MHYTHIQYTLPKLAPIYTSYAPFEWMMRVGIWGVSGTGLDQNMGGSERHNLGRGGSIPEFFP